mgnify:CR=1 FL=1
MPRRSRDDATGRPAHRAAHDSYNCVVGVHEFARPHRVRTTARTPTSNDAYLRWNPFRTVDRRDSQQGKPCHSNQTSSRRQRALTLAALPFTQASAGDVSVGGGVAHQLLGHRLDVDDGEGGQHDSSSDFALNSARLSHQRQGDRQHRLHVQHRVQPSDEKHPRHRRAAAQFSFSGGKHNIWVGRFLPPSDRANLYGPYYASNWARVPGRRAGRLSVSRPKVATTASACWGQYDKVKFSIGALRRHGLTTGDSDVLLASRVQVDFWDKEDGYYLNGTVLRREGPAGHSASRRITADAGEAYTFDFLLEKKLGNSGVITVESEVLACTTASAATAPPVGGWLREVGWLLRTRCLSIRRADAGPGKFQLLAKYGQATYDFFGTDLDQDTMEFDVN